MKVEIESDKCQGHARCESLCPEVFGLDADGFAFVRMNEVPPELRASVLAAQLNCPERAVMVDEG